MVAVEAVVSSISEPLTWAEICERYPDQLDFRTARVAGHGKTRREAFEQARAGGGTTVKLGVTSQAERTGLSYAQR